MPSGVVPARATPAATARRAKRKRGAVRFIVVVARGGSEGRARDLQSVMIGIKRDDRNDKLAFDSHLHLADE